MCELFAITGRTSISVNDYLKEFFSHSTDHPDGWGMAFFYGNAVSLEKEPIRAIDSSYLRERLKHHVEGRNMIAHIRQATRGRMVYENCHPFVMRDIYDRAWTLMHNGTIFDCDELSKYIETQDGQTDSERIICYLMDKVNEKENELGRPLMPEERFEVVDQMIHVITPNNNKVNLILFDGELMYVHTNLRGTLYMKRIEQAVMFSTVPLDDAGWEKVPFMTLLGYREGKLLFTGRPHENEYFLKPENMNHDG